MGTLTFAAQAHCSPRDQPINMHPANDQVRVEVTDYRHPGGWEQPANATARTRQFCEQLEEGRILFFNGIPFEFPVGDREFLLGQRQSATGLHKNVSYRPQQDRIKGSAADTGRDRERLHDIMRRYSKAVVGFLEVILKPYAANWRLDFASFRPEQEQGRDLPVHKRNDLLHVDSFPTRPTHGARILRCFTNINPTEPRIWITTDGLPDLARRHASDAGLDRIAAAGPGGSWFGKVKRAVGIPGADRSAYDRFMLRFHDYLKENHSFQSSCPKIRIEFPPVSTWLCYTDSVPHAVLSGQYALEQTFLISPKAMVTPEKSPIRVLENLAGKPLARWA